MKRVVLIDFQGGFVASALAVGDVKISLLVTSNARIARRCQETFGDKIQECWWCSPDTYEEWEAMTNSEYDLSYEDIQHYRDVQQKLERYYHRVADNIAEIKLIYYSLLKKFLGFFHDHQIDMVFSTYLEHGAVDSLLMGIAKHQGIPCYSLTSYIAVSDRLLYSVIDQNQGKIMDIGKWGLTTFSERDTSELLKKVSSFYSADLWQKFRIWRRRIRRLFGYWWKHLTSLLRTRKEPKYFILSNYGMSYEDALNNFSYVAKLKRYYKSLATHTDLSQKYFFYALHQDPEATTMVRTTMESQLFIIKTLSQHLPPGYKLYVKEHPSTFFIYEKFPYFLRNIRYFRSFSFYEYIKKFPNVELVSMDTPTSSLIKNAAAVSSICGTTFLESVLYKKPIIVWGENTTFVEFLREAYCIRSESDVGRTFLDIIRKESPPLYADFTQVLTQYTYADEKISLFQERSITVRSQVIHKLLEYVSPQSKLNH